MRTQINCPSVNIHDCILKSVNFIRGYEETSIQNPLFILFEVVPVEETFQQLAMGQYLLLSLGFWHFPYLSYFNI